MLTTTERYTLPTPWHTAPTPTEQRDQRSTRLRSLSAERLTLDPSLAARIHPAALSATPLTDANAFGSARFWDALAGRAAPAPDTITWRETNNGRVNRMLTLAGLYTVDAGVTPRVREILDDTRLSQCLAMGQLDLRQCASVAAAASEDAHCLARHGLTQPAACFAEIGAQ